MIQNAFIASLWAGLLALDITGIGPMLIAQPMIAGPIFGYLMGNLAVGLIIGGIVQLLWMDVTPVGVGIPYDATAVTLLAVFWSTLPGGGSLSQMVLALALAVPFGALFKRMDQWSRRGNTKLLHRIESASDDRLSVVLAGGMLAALAWNYLRYAVSFFAAMVAGGWLWQRIGYFPKDTPLDRAMIMAIILLPLAGMSVALDLFLSEEPDARWSARLGFKTGGRRSGDSR